MSARVPGKYPHLVKVERKTLLIGCQDSQVFRHLPIRLAGVRIGNGPQNVRSHHALIFRVLRYVLRHIHLKIARQHPPRVSGIVARQPPVLHGNSGRKPRIKAFLVSFFVACRRRVCCCGGQPQHIACGISRYRGTLQHRNFGIRRQQRESLSAPARGQMHVQLVIEHCRGHRSLAGMLFRQILKRVVLVLIDDRVLLNPSHRAIRRFHFQKSRNVLQHREPVAVLHFCHSIGHHGNSVAQINLLHCHIYILRRRGSQMAASG